MTGLFISFEGIDGAGKSTPIQALAELLSQKNHQLTISREPGGTELAEQIRQLVLNKKMDSLTEALLVFAARRDHLIYKIKPALDRGDIVLCDRFTDATFAYQGYGRGFDLTVLQTLEQWVQLDTDTKQLCQPDLTFWFDVPLEVAKNRLEKNETLDRFETESQYFFQRVRDGYVQRAKEFPQRFVRIDSQQDKKNVFKQIVGILQQRNII